MKENHYRHLGIMAALSFIAMYISMFAMVNSLDNLYLNVNQRRGGETGSLHGPL